MREGGLNNLELRGDMNLQISDADLGRVKLSLAPAPASFGPELQFKQHPNVGKFVANRDRIVALKDPSRSFPVGQPLAVLKWRYAGKDETYVPLSSESIRAPASPSPSPNPAKWFCVLLSRAANADISAMRAWWFSQLLADAVQ